MQNPPFLEVILRDFDPLPRPTFWVYSYAGLRGPLNMTHARGVQGRGREVSPRGLGDIYSPILDLIHLGIPGICSSNLHKLNLSALAAAGARTHAVKVSLYLPLGALMTPYPATGGRYNVLIVPCRLMSCLSQTIYTSGTWPEMPGGEEEGGGGRTYQSRHGRKPGRDRA